MKCYIVTDQDRKIASLVDGWDGVDVARLRGMYDDQAEKENKPPLDTSDSEKAAKILIDHRRKLLVSSMKESYANMADSFITLRNTFTAETRMARVQMIALLFSKTIDSIQKSNKNYSREQICNGFTDAQGKHGGEFNIFENVYNSLRNLYSRSLQTGNTYRAEEIKKVLDNFGALCSFARIILRDTEGLKLGNKLEYAKGTDESNFGDNDITSIFDPNESKREGWQEMNEFISAFSRIGKSVRRVLSTIQLINEDKRVQDIKNGVDPRKAGIETDDIGFPKFLNPVTAHQALMEELRGVTSESHLKRMLAKSKLSWASQVLAIINSNPQVSTQFYVDFKKAFQPYKEVKYEYRSDGTVFVRTYIMNKIMNLLSGAYNTRIKLGKTLSPNSVYNSDGTINWENVQNFRSKVKEWFSQEVTGTFAGQETKKASKFYDRSTSLEERAKVLVDLSNSIGIDLDLETANKLVRGGRKNLTEYVTNIKESVEFGFDAHLTKEDIKALEEGRYSEVLKSKPKLKKFANLFKAKTEEQSKKDKRGNIQEKVQKLLDIVAKERESVRMESRVTHKDKKGKTNTLYSYVNPCYMSDQFELINSYAKEGDRDGLRKYLETKYLDSAMFRREDGTILNKWIEELYNCDLSKEGNFAETLMYSRFLGSEDVDFENFTSKQHALEMMHEFFFAENMIDKSDKRRYAHYPVFILGDSGVAKYIRAKRYSFEDIMDGLYNIYISELRRNELVKATNEKLEKDGFQKLRTVKEDTFAMLPFLNDAPYRPNGNVADWTENDVRDAIYKYLVNEIAKFKDKLKEFGLLETTANGMPKYFAKEVVAYQGDMDKLIADYYCNTKFATLQQFQLMTIDVAFYENTKDLQKRYKEIHAPGTAASIEARDFDGNLYSGNTDVDQPAIETAIYFDDIRIPADDAFLSAIKEHFGENSSYSKYLKNTLTDGQGYRTLDSYRKVMGMLGEWTREMEDAYKKIKALRATYGEDAEIPAEILDEIANLAIVFQPIKPYLFTIENYRLNNNGGVLKIPVQHKYAEAVLIPELLPKGSMLRDLAYAMEKHVDANGNPQPIDLVCATTVVKVGNFGATSLSEVRMPEDYEGPSSYEVDGKEALTVALSQGYVHQLNYADYRKQTNVPEHINSSQLFGTQLRKLIMAGITMAKDYSSYLKDTKTVNIAGQQVSLTGRNLINLYNSLIVANILESYDLFEKEVSNPKTLSQMLQQGIINNSRESMDNLLSFALEDDGFHMPLFEGGLEHDAAAMLLSIFKKRVNKQEIRGGSAVQVSAMGIKGYEEDGDLKYVVDPNNPSNILYAEVEVPWDLSVNVNGREVELNFSDYCNSDGTLILDKNGKPKLENQFPGILSRVAYRIPTERDYSMINIRIKRFSQKIAGGTIKVPAAGTTIAGFDFDIDKLYFMMREYTVRDIQESEVGDIWRKIYKENPEVYNRLKEAQLLDEKGKGFLASFLKVFNNVDELADANEKANAERTLISYWTKAGLSGSPQELFDDYVMRHYSEFMAKYDYTKTVLQQSSKHFTARAIRNNLLIDLIQARLEDEETFSQRYTPGGFANSSRAAREMRELQFAPINDIYHDGKVDFEAINKRADNKELDPEPNYDPSDPMTIITYNQQNQVAGKLIGIFANQNTNHAFTSLVDKFELNIPISFCGHSYYDLLHAPEGTDPDLYIAECLAASVDAVKDPVLNFLNFNTVTADAGGLLARLGYTPMEIGLLFNQPIIKEVCEMVFNENISAEEAINRLKSYYADKITQNSINRPDNNSFSAETLATIIIQDRSRRENGEYELSDKMVNHQMQVLDLFTSILKSANEVSEFVNSTKFTASNAVGSTFGDMYAQQMKVRKYIEGVNGKGANISMQVSTSFETPIHIWNTEGMNNEEYILKIIGQGLGNPFAYEQAMYDMNVRAVNILNKYFPYNTKVYASARELARKLTRSQTLNADTINDIHTDMLSYLLAQREGPFDGEGLNDYGYKDESGRVLTRKEYYTQVFPEKLAKLIEEQPELKSLAIFQYMLSDTNDEGVTTLKLQDVGGLDSKQKDAIRDSWTELALGWKDESNPGTINIIAKDLFMYNFYKVGFAFSPKAFMHLAPVAVKEAIVVDNDGTTYKEFLNKILKGEIMVNSEAFMKQFILNHLDNWRFNYTVRTRSGNKSNDIDNVIKNKAIVNGQMVRTFTLSLKDLGDNKQLLISGEESKKYKYTSEWVPCIIVNGSVYLASYEGNEGFNISVDDSMQYRYAGEVSDFGFTSYHSDSRPELDGNTSREAGIADTPPTPNREGIINEIIDGMIELGLKDGDIMAEEVEGYRTKLREALNSTSDQDLMDTVNHIRQSKKEIIDATGNKVC